jgi:hypothetical protein
MRSTPIPEKSQNASFINDAHRTLKTLVRKFSRGSLSDMISRSSSGSHLSQLQIQTSRGSVESSCSPTNHIVRVASLSQLPTN